MVLIGSQYSAVTVSRYYFRINRISDRIRYFNIGIDPNSRTTRLQRRIHTRIVDYDCGILRFQVRALLRKIHNNIPGVSYKFFFYKFVRIDLFSIIIISFVFYYVFL